MSERKSCNKRSFSSREKAKALLGRIRGHGTSQGFRARIYLCSNCSSYHLTNNEKSGTTSSGRSAFRQKKRREERRRERQKTSRSIRDWRVA